MDIEINFCQKSDKKDVMKFIHDYYRPNHILSYHDALFDWQHWDRESSHYSFVIAREKSSGEVLATIGYLKTSFFDESLIDQDTLWLTTWQVQPHVPVAGLGLTVHSFLTKNKTYQAVGTVGTNDQVVHIYKALGYQTGVLNQYYLLNESKTEYFLIQVDGNNHSSRTNSDEVKLEKLSEDSQIWQSPGTLILDKRKRSFPQKTPQYFFNRYIKSTFYKYDVFQIKKGSKILGLLAIRMVEHEGNRGLRFIDYLGEPEGLCGTYKAFQELLKDKDAEYVDVYNIGIDESIFFSSGFKKLDLRGDEIVPNHFEPYARINFKCIYAFKTSTQDSYVLFKGDCDQDRPNSL